jgi:hypothetical protein
MKILTNRKIILGKGIINAGIEVDVSDGIARRLIELGSADPAQNKAVPEDEINTQEEITQEEIVIQDDEPPKFDVTPVKKK